MEIWLLQLKLEERGNLQPTPVYDTKQYGSESCYVRFSLFGSPNHFYHDQLRSLIRNLPENIGNVEIIGWLFFYTDTRWEDWLLWNLFIDSDFVPSKIPVYEDKNRFLKNLFAWTYELTGSVPNFVNIRKNKETILGAATMPDVYLSRIWENFPRSRTVLMSTLLYENDNQKNNIIRDRLSCSMVDRFDKIVRTLTYEDELLSDEKELTVKPELRNDVEALIISDFGIRASKNKGLNKIRTEFDTHFGTNGITYFKDAVLQFFTCPAMSNADVPAFPETVPITGSNHSFERYIINYQNDETKTNWKAYLAFIPLMSNSTFGVELVANAVVADAAVNESMNANTVRLMLSPVFPSKMIHDPHLIGIVNQATKFFQWDAATALYLRNYVQNNQVSEPLADKFMRLFTLNAADGLHNLRRHWGQVINEIGKGIS